jgi:predicted aspartyl protease
MEEGHMGTFSVIIEVGNLQGGTCEELEAMPDTGATPTVIPASVLRRLGITPTQRKIFEYANGNQVELDMAPAIVRVEGEETITWVIFGEEGGGALLGAYTLEGMFLGVDPYNQSLTPVRGVL